MMRYLLDHDNLKYQLETLAQHEPDDLDSTEFDVAYENESGAEGMATVCCIDLAARSLSRIKELEAALYQQDAVPVFMWHKGATDEESEVVDVDCACPCCAPLYTAPPSTAQGDPEEIRERVARIINTKGYEKLHCIVGQKGAEDIRFLVDCLRGV